MTQNPTGSEAATGPTQRLDPPPYTPPTGGSPEPSGNPQTVEEMIARLEWENQQIDTQLEQMVANANHEIGRYRGIKETNMQHLEILRRIAPRS